MVFSEHTQQAKINWPPGNKLIVNQKMHCYFNFEKLAC